MSPVYHSDPARHGLRVIFDLGEMLPLHATASGLAILAFGPEGIVDIALSGDLSSFAPNTVITRPDIMHLIGQFRTCGYSFSDQYFTKDIVSFGMPFFGPDGEVVGTLAVPVPQSRLSDELKTQILSALRDGCKSITQSGGGIIPTTLEEIWQQIPAVESPHLHETS